MKQKSSELWIGDYRFGQSDDDIHKSCRRATGIFNVWNATFPTTGCEPTSGTLEPSLQVTHCPGEMPLPA